MRNGRAKADDMEMKAEYDFSKGVRGKYAKSFAKGTNIVVLDPDVVKVFRNSREANGILRTLTRLANQKARWANSIPGCVDVLEGESRAQYFDERCRPDIFYSVTSQCST
jgi:hypothetical protein